MLRWLNGFDRRQLGLAFGLRRHAVVAELIERKFGPRLGVTSVAALRQRLHLTPKGPLQRAYQRDPQAIECWQHVARQEIARQARCAGADRLQ